VAGLQILAMCGLGGKSPLWTRFASFQRLQHLIWSVERLSSGCYDWLALRQQDPRAVA
jgi:hypothetical protein